MNWSEEYQRYLDNPPKAGDILSAYGDEPARLDVELTEGKPPFIYGRAYVPCVVGTPLGWFLQPATSDQAHGWKCILLPKAREECIRKLGVSEKILKVKSLRVVRVSQSGNSLLCEVAAYV